MSFIVQLRIIMGDDMVRGKCIPDRSPMSQSPSPQPPHPVAQPVPVTVTLAILGASSLTVMANATIAPALPGLRDHFADTPGIETLAGLILSLPSLFVVLTAGVFGLLADRFDKRPLLICAMAVYAIGGASGLYVDGMMGLLIGRVLLGLGVAGSMTVASAYIGTIWQGAARDKFTGLQVASMNLGGIVFMTSGGLLAVAHWRLPFAIYLIAIPLMAFAWIALANTPGRVGAASEAGAGDGPPASDGFPWAAFLWVGPFAFILMVSFYTLPTRLPFLLADRAIGGPAATGLILSASTLASIPGALGYGRIRRFASPMTIMAVGFFVSSIGMAIVATTHSLPVMVAGVMLAGGPMGMMFPNFIAFFMGLVPMQMRGRAAGLFTMSVFGGQFISPLVSAPLIARFGLGGGMLAMAVLPVLAGLFITVMFKRAPQQPIQV